MMTSTARSRQSGSKPSTPKRNSPPAIVCRMPSLIARVLARSVGGTGSSYHDSDCGSSRAATSMARGTSKLLCTSIFRATSGPMAARIASMQAMPSSVAASTSAAGASRDGKPSNGAALTARKPSPTACRALAAKPSGVRSDVARLMFAYAGNSCRREPPVRSYTGAPSALPTRSHWACSTALNAVATARSPAAAASRQRCR